MAIVLLTVKATIEPDHEAAFNHWYDTEHCAQLLRFPGAVSARRYKTLMSDDKHQNIAVYEFDSEESFARFQDSREFEDLLAEYDAKFGAVSTRIREAYVQTYP